MGGCHGSSLHKHVSNCVLQEDNIIKFCQFWGHIYFEIDTQYDSGCDLKRHFSFHLDFKACIVAQGLQ